MLLLGVLKYGYAQLAKEKGTPPTDSNTNYHSGLKLVPIDIHSGTLKIAPQEGN